MVGSLNRVMLIGNLGKEPEVRKTQDGREIVNFSLATNESWRDKATGEKRERTEWHRVVVFNEALVNVAKNFLKKGSKIFLEGTLQTRKWTDSNGQERYTTEVALQGYNCSLNVLDGRKEGSGNYNDDASLSPGNHSDDEVPF
ncbi:MAG: single-stranded DNA-binding protein [Alphaproteobacteria bacterium]|jgi:single-strand DNA-binding protein